MPFPLTTDHSLHNIPERIRRLHQRGQGRLKRALTTARRLSGTPVDISKLLSQGLQLPSRPDSRISVLSLGSLTAWNRLSMISMQENDSDHSVKYRVHQASTCASTPRTSISVERGEAITLQGRLLDVQDITPAALEYEFASETYGQIPSTTRYPFPAQDADEAEPWHDFMSRVLCHETSQSMIPRTFNAELEGSVVTFEKEQVAFEGPEKYTEAEWQALESLVLLPLSPGLPAEQSNQAVVHKQREATIAKMVSREDIKLVTVQKPLASPRSDEMPSRRRYSLSTVSSAPGCDQLIDSLPLVITKQRPASSFSHHTTSKNRKSNYKLDVHGDRTPSQEPSRSQRRDCGLVQVKKSLELHLPPKPASEFTSPAETAGDIYQRPSSVTSWYEDQAKLTAFHSDDHPSLLPAVLVPSSKHNIRWSAPVSPRLDMKPPRPTHIGAQQPLSARRNARPLLIPCSTDIDPTEVPLRSSSRSDTPVLGERQHRKPGAISHSTANDIRTDSTPPMYIQQLSRVSLNPIKEGPSRDTHHKTSRHERRSSTTPARPGSSLRFFSSSRPDTSRAASIDIPRIVVTSPPPQPAARAPIPSRTRSRSTKFLLASFPVPPTATTCPSPSIPRISSPDPARDLSTKLIKRRPLPTGAAILRRATSWRQALGGTSSKDSQQRARADTLHREHTLRVLGHMALGSHPPFVSDRNFAGVAAYAEC